jgi:hypothetical protein
MNDEAKARKMRPVCTGVLDYFPDALLAVAEVSRVGNEQHNPGEPLHWAKEKSTDEADALVRHLLDRGTRDKDGVRHSAKVAWRALALLQRELDAAVAYNDPRADPRDTATAKIFQSARDVQYAPIRPGASVEIRPDEYGLTVPYSGLTVGDPPAHPLDHSWSEQGPED